MVSDLNALFGRIGAGVFQQAWVVEDLARAESAMQGSLGCGEFTKYVMDEAWDLRGRPVSCKLSLGFARSGNKQIELMQPLEGEGVQFEFLERRGPGLHHFGALVDDLDSAASAAAAWGFPPVMAGQFASVRLCFLDTIERFGAYVELIEDPHHVIWASRPWLDASPFASPSRN